VKSRSWWAELDPTLVEAQPECNADLITELYADALNINGLASPPPAQLDEKLSCFEHHTSRTVNQYVKEQLQSGYPPTDPNRTAISNPHDDLINFVVDGMCMFAMTMERMLFREKKTIDELRTPAEGLYRRVVRHMKERLAFTGASGQVKIAGNDLPNTLAILQAVGNTSKLVGIAYTNPGELDIIVEIDWHTMRNASWTVALSDPPPPKEDPFPILAVVIPILIMFFCGIVCYAAITSRRGTKDIVTKET